MASVARWRLMMGSAISARSASFASRRRRSGKCTRCILKLKCSRCWGPMRANRVAIAIQLDRFCFRSKTDSPRRPSTKGKLIRLTTACMAGTNSILRALLFLGFRGPDWHRRLHLRLCPGVLLGLPGLELLEQGFLLGIRLHFCTRWSLPQELLKPVAGDGLDPVLIKPLLSGRE